MGVINEMYELIAFIAVLLLIGDCMTLTILFMIGCNIVSRRYDEQIDEMMRMNKEFVDRAERRGHDGR